MSEYTVGSIIKDRGYLSLTVGYRFETDQGKADAEIIDDVIDLTEN